MNSYSGVSWISARELGHQRDSGVSIKGSWGNLGSRNRKVYTGGGDRRFFWHSACADRFCISWIRTPTGACRPRWKKRRPSTMDMMILVKTICFLSRSIRPTTPSTARRFPSYAPYPCLRSLSLHYFLLRKFRPGANRWIGFPRRDLWCRPSGSLQPDAEIGIRMHPPERRACAFGRPFLERGSV
jgi:hypothetical protein